MNGVLLDKNFEACWNGKRYLFFFVALIMGSSRLGDRATIGKKSLLNIMSAADGIFPLWLELMTAHNRWLKMERRIPGISEVFKDHIKELFKSSNEPEKLRLLKNTTCVFFFDSASKVQKAGKALTMHYPYAHCLSGVEYVSLLSC